MTLYASVPVGDSGVRIFGPVDQVLGAVLIETWRQNRRIARVAYQHSLELNSRFGMPPLRAAGSISKSRREMAENARAWTIENGWTTVERIQQIPGRGGQDSRDTLCAFMTVILNAMRRYDTFQFWAAAGDTKAPGGYLMQRLTRSELDLINDEAACRTWYRRQSSHSPSAHTIPTQAELSHAPRPAPAVAPVVRPAAAPAVQLNPKLHPQASRSAGGAHRRPGTGRPRVSRSFGEWFMSLPSIAQIALTIFGFISVLIAILAIKAL